MPLTVDRYTVLLASTDEAVEASEHVVAVIHADRVAAEVEGPKHGLPQMEGRPLAFMGLWLWLASRRAGVIDGDEDFKTFENRLLNFEEYEEPAAFPGDAPVVDELGPTTREGIVSPSVSLPSSADSSSGSTPEPIRV